MKRKGWRGFLIGIGLCLLMVLPQVVHASLDIYGSYGGYFLGLNNENVNNNYGFSDGTLNKDAYVETGTYFGAFGANTNGWKIFNDGGTICNSSSYCGSSNYNNMSGIIFGDPMNGLLEGSVYNSSGIIVGGTDGIKMGAGTVTNGGTIYGYGGNGINQYSLGASNFTVTNGVNIPLTVTFDPDTYAMTVTPGTPEITGIGTIHGYYDAISSYIGGAGSATVDNAGLIIGDYGPGVGLYGNGTSTATVTNTGTIYGGYGGSGGSGVDIDGVLTATVTNSGMIDGDDEGVRIANTNTATVTNNTNATISGYEGVDFYEVNSVTVDNSGTISGRYGVDVNHADTVNITNKSGGTIRGQYGITIDEAGTVDISNAGTIRGQYGIYVDDSGSVKITNNDGGTIRGQYGVYVENTDSVEINNNAGSLIRGGDESIYISYVGSATINNSGTIYSNDDDGIYIYDADTVDITNNEGGLIDTWDEGIEIGYGGSATVTNSGVIDAVNEGVNIYNFDTATVDNSGTINSYDDVGVYMENIDGVATAKVINSGTITGMEGVAIYHSMTAEVDNKAGGIIEGYFNGVNIHGIETDATVNNAGIIIGYGGSDYEGSDGNDSGYGYGYDGGDGLGFFSLGDYGLLTYQVDGAVSINNSGIIIGYAADGIGGDGGTADYSYGYYDGGEGGLGWGAMMGLGISVSEVGSVYIENSGTVIGYGGNGIGGNGGDAINDYGNYSIYGGDGGDGIGGSFFGMGGGFGIGIYQVAGLAEVNNSGTAIGYGGDGIGGNGGNVYYDNSYYYSYAGYGGDGEGAVGYGITMMDVGSAKVTNTSNLTIIGYGGDGIGGNGGNAYYSDGDPFDSYSGYAGDGGDGYGGDGYGVFITNFDTALTSATVTNSGTIIGYGGNGIGGDGGYGGYNGYGGYGFGGDGVGVYIDNAQIVTVDNSGTISGVGGNGVGGYGSYGYGYGGVGFGGSGIGLYIDDAETVTVNNQEGGIISGASGSDDLDYSFNEIQNNDDFSYGVLVTDVLGTATVNNAGTISGTGSFTGEYIDGYYGSINYSIGDIGFGDLYIDEFYFEDLHGSYDIDYIDMPLGGGVLFTNVGSAVVNNSGTIEGGLFGVAIGGYNTMETVNVTNSGTISAVSTGVFDIDYFSAYMDNLYLDVHTGFGPYL